MLNDPRFYRYWARHAECGRCRVRHIPNRLRCLQKRLRLSCQLHTLKPADVIKWLWLSESFKGDGRLVDSLGDLAHPAQLNDSSQWRGPAIMSGQGPTYQNGTGTSAVTASSVSYLSIGPNISDRHTTAVIGSLWTPQQSPMILFGKTY